jgi:hypothetical protein
MRAGRLAVVALAGIVAAVMAPHAMAAKKPPKLVATFGAGLTFDVKRGKKLLSSGADGSATVKARKYRFVVRDNSSFHNFRLVNAKGKTIKGKLRKKKRMVLTGVGATRKKATTYVLNLKKGVYTLICDPHETVGMTVKLTAK